MLTAHTVCCFPLRSFCLIWLVLFWTRSHCVVDQVRLKFTEIFLPSSASHDSTFLLVVTFCTTLCLLQRKVSLMRGSDYAICGHKDKCLI
jgi:hypothetical protein